jgi:SAM-dependent methyltransferase
MHSDPRAWFDATAERMLAGRTSAGDLEVVGDLDAFQADKRRRVLRWLGGRPLGGRHLLEVGCGAAGNLRFLRAHGARVEGADISPKMIDVARRLNAANGVEFPLHVIDGAHLPHPDASFDVVLTVTALQHNHDGPQLDALTAEMARVLCPGGEAWILEGVHARRTVHRQSVHRGHAEYVKMFEHCGLALQEATAIHSHYPHWMARYQQLSTAARRALHRLRGSELHSEADYLQRYGDGARLDGVASRSLFALSRLLDPVHRGPDALGIFVFEKPARG